ncbi:MAG: SBBP repeat-containing protein [Clostridia bacterium]|nr:SBBP repeat-containing protein [Clostridia bacterium]
MMKKIALLLIFVMLFNMASFASKIVSNDEQNDVENEQVILSDFENLKISPTIIKNEGQIDSKVDYYFRAPYGDVFILKNGKITYDVFEVTGEEEEKNKKGIRFEEQLIGGSMNKARSLNEVKTNTNYFIGNDKENWVLNSSASSSIDMGEVYNGINLSLHASEDNIEKVFTVSPNGDVDDIRIKVNGAEEMNLSSDGELIVEAGSEKVAFSKPYTYQIIDGNKIEIESNYIIDKKTYGFTIGEYNQELPLIIDPYVVVSYFGGKHSYTNASGIKVDEFGNIYVVGSTIYSSYQTTIGAYDEVFNGSNGYRDIFVSKFDNEMTTLLASTFLGSSGNANDYGRVIEILENGDVIIGGTSSGTSYPTTVGTHSNTNTGSVDVVLSRLSSDLSTLIASTYVGGLYSDDVKDIILDKNGFLYVLANVTNNFPVSDDSNDTNTKGAYTKVCIFKIDKNLTNIIRSTFLGGNDHASDVGVGMAIDGTGDVIVVGYTYDKTFPTTLDVLDTVFTDPLGKTEGFVSRFDSNLTTLKASTFIGGSNYDYVTDVAIDSRGNILITGYSNSSDFSMISGGYQETRSQSNYDAFVLKLNQEFDTVINGTFIASNNTNIGRSIAVDSSGAVHIAGHTKSSNYPLTSDAHDTTLNYGYGMIYTKFDETLSELLYSTYISGHGDDLTYDMYLDRADTVYIGGLGESFYYPPSTAGVLQLNGQGGLVAKFERPLSGEGAVPYALGKGEAALNGSAPTGVALNIGAYVHEMNLMNVEGVIPIEFSIKYNSLLKSDGDFGVGWLSPYKLEITEVLTGGLRLNINENQYVDFTDDATGKLTGVENDYQFTSVSVNEDSTYTVESQNGTKYNFDHQNLLESVDNKFGQRMSFTKDSSNRLQRITDDISGRYIELGYDVNGRVGSLSDNAARTVLITYTPDGHLETITDVMNEIWTFSYDFDGRMEHLKDPYYNELFSVSYDSFGRVISLDDGRSDNLVKTFNYIENATLGTVETSVTNRNGFDTKTIYNTDGKVLSVVDALQNETVYNYDEIGQLNQVLYPNSSYVSFEYDGNGNIVEIAKPNAVKTFFSFDGKNNLLTVTDASGNLTQYEYYSNNQLKSIQDALNNVTSYTYTTDGLLQTITQPKSGVTTYSYVNGDTYSVKDHYDNFTYYEYYPTGLVKKTIDPANHITEFVYNNAGQTLETIDHLNQSEIRAYDKRGLLLSITDRRNNKTSYTYDVNGNIKTIDFPHSQTLTYDYNGEDQVKTIMNESLESIQFFYDALGREIKTIDKNGNQITKSYDSVGNVKTMEDGYGIQTASYEYDLNNYLMKISDAYLNETTYVNDLLGNPTVIADKEGNTTAYSYDSLKRINEIVNSQNNRVSYQFDDDGNLESQTDLNGNIMNMTYDSMQRMLSKTFATGSTINMTYNNLGLLETYQNARGNTFAFGYDELNRLATQSFGQETISYNYDENSNLVEVTDGVNSTNRTYDSENRTLTYTDTNGYTVAYSYDSKGNVETMTYPGNKVVTYGYDSGNRLTSVLDWNGGLTSYTYDNNNRLKTISRANGTIATYNYDLKGRVTGIHDEDYQDSEIYSISVNYDKEINPILETYDSRTVSNIYDNIYQLTDSDENDSSGVLIKSYDYDYDAGGNMIFASTTSAVITITVDNRIDTFNGTQVIYDADGNMTYGPLGEDFENFSYDEKNRLQSLKDFSFEYDVEGKRTKVTSGSDTTTYFNSPSDIEHVLIKNENGVETYYIYGVGIVSEITGSETKYYHLDYRGNTTALSDEQGIVTDTFKYSPFGDVIERTGNYEPIFQYAANVGVVKDESGLYYMRARYYSSDIRRFITRDTYEGNSSNALSLNNYSYVLNNPKIYVDPDGHFVVSAALTVYLATLVSSPDFYFDMTFLAMDIASGDWSAVKWDLVGVAVAFVPTKAIDFSVTFVKNNSPTIVKAVKSKLDDAMKFAKGLFKGGVDDVARPFTKSSLKLGQEMHKAYKADVVDGITKFKEYRLPSGKRIDFIDFETKTIYELKPYNPNQIKAGTKQLDGYLKEVEEVFGEGWKTVLDTY